MAGGGAVSGYVPAVLRAGPFHGDKGLVKVLPSRIWVFNCPHRECDQGIHWTDVYDKQPVGGGEPYDLEGQDDRGVSVYVWCVDDSRPHARAMEARA